MNSDKQVKGTTPNTTESQSPPSASSNTVTQLATEQSTSQLTVSLPDNPPRHDAVPCKGGCLLKTAVAIVRSGDHQYHAHILFDEGAQRSFITKQLAKSLSIVPSKSQVVNISAFGGDTSSQKLNLATVSIRAKDVSDIPISALVIPKIAAPLQNLIPDPGECYPYLRGLPLPNPVQGTDKFEISLLVGADFYWQIVQDRVVRGNGPTAVESKIGYLLSGPLSPHANTDIIEALHPGITSLHTSTDTKRLWDIEFTGITSQSTLCESDPRIIDYISSSVRRKEDGSYVLKFPWKPNHPYLPSNRGICEKQARSLARKLSQTPDQLKTYGNIIAEQLTRGFIEKVAESDVPQHCHFIPHHAVKKSLPQPLYG